MQTCRHATPTHPAERHEQHQHGIKKQHTNTEDIRQYNASEQNQTRAQRQAKPDEVNDEAGRTHTPPNKTCKKKTSKLHSFEDSDEQHIHIHRRRKTSMCNIIPMKIKDEFNADKNIQTKTNEKEPSRTVKTNIKDRATQWKEKKR